MAFCSNCGAELPESGVCPNCPPVAQPVTVAPVIVHNPIFEDALGTVKKIFSSDPQAAVTSAAKLSSPIWAVFGALSVIFGALTFMLIPRGLFGEIFDAVNSLLGYLSMWGGYGSSDVSLPLGALFGWGLLLALISFAVLGVLVKLLYIILGHNVSIVKVMNLVSASLLPLTVACVLAVVFSFFFVQLSVLLVVVGWLVSVLLMYKGVRDAAELSSSAFWGFIAVQAIDLIVFYFVASKIIGSVVSGAFSGMF